MKSTHAYLFRDCALWFNEDVKVGQSSSITISSFKAKTEKFRNAGMVTERETSFGYERENAKFKQLGLDPQVISGLGFIPGTKDSTLMVTAALVDEDGTVTNATCYLRGFLKGIEFGEFKSGEKVDALDCEYGWDYLKLEIGGSEIIEADDFDIKIAGVSQYGAIRAALLL
ncbi:MAG: P2 family phage contractile tail tube protein [Paracoccaceae bacterium]|jgi:P2 family phage contractile tail tube protein